MNMDTTRALVVVQSGSRYLSPVEPSRILRVQNDLPVHRHPVPGYLSGHTPQSKYSYASDGSLDHTKGVYIDIYV